MGVVEPSINQVGGLKYYIQKAGTKKYQNVPKESKCSKKYQNVLLAKMDKEMLSNYSNIELNTRDKKGWTFLRWLALMETKMLSNSVCFYFVFPCQKCIIFKCSRDKLKVGEAHLFSSRVHLEAWCQEPPLIIVIRNAKNKVIMS